MKPKSPRVVLYSTPQCGYCRQLKALLKQWHIPFSEFDVTRNRRAATEFQRLGARAVPLLMIGSTRLDGYRPEQLKKALKKAGFDV